MGPSAVRGPPAIRSRSVLPGRNGPEDTRTGWPQNHRVPGDPCITFLQAHRLHREHGLGRRSFRTRREARGGPVFGHQSHHDGPLLGSLRSDRIHLAPDAQELAPSSRLPRTSRPDPTSRGAAATSARGSAPLEPRGSLGSEWNRSSDPEGRPVRGHSLRSGHEIRRHHSGTGVLAGEPRSPGAPPLRGLRCVPGHDHTAGSVGPGRRCARSEGPSGLGGGATTVLGPRRGLGDAARDRGKVDLSAEPTGLGQSELGNSDSLRRRA